MCRYVPAVNLYWGLRDYGTASWDGGNPECDHRPPDEAGSTTKPTNGQREHAGRFTGPTCWKCGARRIDRQIGLEPTVAEYVATMVDVFREVRRVLRPDGTVWLNLGSSYASGDTGSSLTRRPARVPAYGTDGTAPEGCHDLDSACRDLCDGCLDDYLNHRRRTTHSGQPLGQFQQRESQTDRDTARRDSETASLVVA